MAQDRDRPETIGAHPATDDRDNPIRTEDDFKRADSPEALSDAELAAFPRTALKADSPGWQTPINAALREAVARKGTRTPVTVILRGQAPREAEADVATATGANKTQQADHRVYML